MNVVLAPEKSRPVRRRVRFRQLDDREDGITARENRPENFPLRHARVVMVNERTKARALEIPAAILSFVARVQDGRRVQLVVANAPSFFLSRVTATLIVVDGVSRRLRARQNCAAPTESPSSFWAIRLVL